MNTEDKKEYYRKYYQKNKDKYREYYQKNREHILDKAKHSNKPNTSYMRLYRKTPIGRANMLLQRYKRRDKETNRGDCTLTAQWIVENIFTKPCVHCGEIDWRKIGCNRIDNSKPHTIDNVEPCCGKCNVKLS